MFWTLLVFGISNGKIAMERIPNFKSQSQCEAAAKTVRDTLTPRNESYGFGTVCVQTAYAE